MFYYSRCAHLAEISSTRPITIKTANTIAAEMKVVSYLVVCTPLMILRVEKYVRGMKNQQANPLQKAYTLRNLSVFTLQAMIFTSRKSKTAPPTQQRAGEIRQPQLQEKSPAVQQLVVKEGMKESQLQPRLIEKLEAAVLLKMAENRNSSCAKQIVREQWRPRSVVSGARVSPAMAMICPASVWLGRKLINIQLLALSQQLSVLLFRNYFEELSSPFIASTQDY